MTARGVFCRDKFARLLLRESSLDRILGATQTPRTTRVYVRAFPSIVLSWRCSRTRPVKLELHLFRSVVDCRGFVAQQIHNNPTSGVWALVIATVALSSETVSWWWWDDDDDNDDNDDDDDESRCFQLLCSPHFGWDWQEDLFNTGEIRETSFLFQRVSVLVQRSNAILLHDSLPTADNTHWVSYPRLFLFVIFKLPREVE